MATRLVRFKQLAVALGFSALTVPTFAHAQSAPDAKLDESLRESVERGCTGTQSVIITVKRDYRQSLRESLAAHGDVIRGEFPALNAIAAGEFSPDEPARYHALIDILTKRDYFLVTADFDAYLAAQRGVDGVYADADSWVRKAVLNTAHAGWFSSDRTIRGYARDIWGIPGLDGEGTAR